MKNHDRYPSGGPGVCRVCHPIGDITNGGTPDSCLLPPGCGFGIDRAINVLSPSLLIYVVRIQPCIHANVMPVFNARCDWVLKMIVQTTKVRECNESRNEG